MSTQIEQEEKKKPKRSRKTKAPKKPRTPNKPKTPKPKKNIKEKVSKKIRRFRRWTAFLIIIGFSGYVAYTGWVQYDIPEGYGGLVHTKFTFADGKRGGGFDDTLTVHDGLHWRWEKLLPTNLTMHVYPLDIKTATLSSSGSLPSGETYLAFLEEGGSDRFNWDIRFTITYKLKEEMIPQLASKEGIFQEDLEDFFTRELQLMEGELYGSLKNLSPLDDVQGELEKARLSLNEKHPYLEVTSLAPDVLTLPDTVFYEKARSLYFAYLDARNNALEDMISHVAPQTAVNEEKMKVLEEYGKVLTDYPVLIDFFALDEDNDFGRFTSNELMPEDLGKTE
ncbi:MAG: hypothetical protein PQJ59_04900 [Spirochaetales bacterium]|nr:hypothetical protein [Spirochaetales bacterium]